VVILDAVQTEPQSPPDRRVLVVDGEPRLRDERGRDVIRTVRSLGHVFEP
jgi:hypothetical protein